MISSTLRRRLVAAAATVAASVGVLTAGAALTAAPASAGTPQSVPCNVVPIFETDGYLNTDTGADWFRDFNNRVPAGYDAVFVPYLDGVFPVPGLYASLDDAVADGVGKLDAAVRSYHSRCPGSRIVLAGYSEGAVVAGNEIENLSRSNVIAHNLVRGVLYGDPRRPFGNGGVGGIAGGIETNIPTLLPGITMQGPHNFGDINVAEVCNENDGICNSTNLITNAAAFANGIDGYFNRAHGYRFDPVADQNRGLVFNVQAPLIAYGPPIALPFSLGTPWQIQNLAGPTAGAAAMHGAIAGALAYLPQSVKDGLAADPWWQLINS